MTVWDAACGDPHSGAGAREEGRYSYSCEASSSAYTLVSSREIAAQVCITLEHPISNTSVCQQRTPQYHERESIGNV